MTALLENIDLLPKLDQLVSYKFTLFHGYKFINKSLIWITSVSLCRSMGVRLMILMNQFINWVNAFDLVSTLPMYVRNF